MHELVMRPLEKDEKFSLNFPEFSRFLLDLHCSESMMDFWKNLLRLISGIMPAHSVSIYFNYFEMKTRFWALHHQSLPGNPQPWEERRKVSPTPNYLRANVGKKIFDTKDLLANTATQFHTDYFERVMKTEGWESLLCMAFWEKENPRIMVVIRKAIGQKLFTRSEKLLFKTLYGHCKIVLHRIAQRQSDRVIKCGLSDSLQITGSSVLILDEKLDIIFHNGKALNLCLTWNYGTNDATKYCPAKAFAVPKDIGKACIKLRCSDSHKLPQIVLTLPGVTDKVFVRRILSKETGADREFFCIQFTPSKETQVMCSPNEARNINLLSALSTREKEIVSAAVKGFSNREIACRFGKTEATVKSQLSSVFAKLQIKRRSQLAGILTRL